MTEEEEETEETLNAVWDSIFVRSSQAGLNNRMQYPQYPQMNQYGWLKAQAEEEHRSGSDPAGVRIRLYEPTLPQPGIMEVLDPVLPPPEFTRSPRVYEPSLDDSRKMEATDKARSVPGSSRRRDGSSRHRRPSVV